MSIRSTAFDGRALQIPVAAEVRRWREQDVRRFWFEVFWRCALACAFALLFAGVPALDAWATRPHAQEIERLRPKAELADLIDQRLGDRTPTQRREFDKLMKLPGESRR